MRRLRFGRLLGVAFLALAGVALYRTSMAHIPAAPPHPRVAPPKSSAPAFEACWLEYATDVSSPYTHSAGWPRSDHWNVEIPGVLIRHPSGDVLIDAGNSSRTLEEAKDAPFWRQRMIEQGINGPVIKQTSPQALAKLGVEPTKLKAFIPTHAHFDHIGGLMDLPEGIPLRLPREEIEFLKQVDDGRLVPIVPAQKRRALAAVQEIAFERKPYETFDESLDLFGDGSVVLVRLPGHTPGHLGAFVNLSERARFFYVGDAVNVAEGFERRVGKSFTMAITDFDPPMADATVAKLSQLHEMVPELAILPAHDRDAWTRFFGPEPKCLKGGAEGTVASPNPP